MNAEIKKWESLLAKNSYIEVQVQFNIDGFTYLKWNPKDKRIWFTNMGTLNRRLAECPLEIRIVYVPLIKVLADKVISDSDAIQKKMMESQIKSAEALEDLEEHLILRGL